MTDILRIGALTDADQARSGTKASNLDALTKARFAVPPGIVVPADELWRLLGGEPPSPSFRAGINNAGRLRDHIWRQDDTDLRRWLRQAVNGLREPFAVRSSSRLEDLTSGSSTGIFTSLLGITAADLATAVRHVWADGFSPLALTLHDTLAADHCAVLIQEQIRPVAAGVCFSIDPRSGGSDALVECVSGTADALVDGTAPAGTYRIRRADLQVRAPAVNPLDDAAVQDIVRQALAIETLFGHPVDVEFAVAGGRTYIVQARPITTGSAHEATEPVRVVPVDDTVAATEIATGGLADLLAARTDKRRYVRLAARRRGFLVPGEWFIRAGPGLADPAGRIVRQATDLARTDVIEVAAGDGKLRRVRCEGLAEFLQDFTGGTVFVAESYIGETSGYAALRGDGSMVVEFVPGAAGGLMFGTGPFSTAVVAAGGELLTSQIRAADGYWTMDPATLDITRVRRRRSPEPLDAGQLTGIRTLAAGMAEDFGEVRIEWMQLPGGPIMLWDLTLESGPPLSASDDLVISTGRARGPAVVLTDLEELERVLDDRSVIGGRDFHEAHGSESADRARRNALRGKANPIVITPWPKTTLSLLIGHVAGFVFDDATLLSHLPIILREHGIPAIRLPGSTAAVRTGADIEIGPDGIQVHR
ncbi:MAG TPA: PEP/pyruvate-binding domain-containing protein [Mycobacteriales bacterium]|nr:PEP/pyruvate-binding domain-containing protein [Mycobacteriales bacterium]